MAIPYNDNLKWGRDIANPNWFNDQSVVLNRSLINNENLCIRSMNELFAQAIPQPFARSVQLIRDGLRLVLKVPIRAIRTPIVLSKNWKELERAKINAKLTGYSFIQLFSVPIKFLVAFLALVTSAVSFAKAKWLLDKSEGWTAYLDGRASQLEALKEEAGKFSENRQQYDQYKTWLYTIEPKLCRKSR